MQSSSVLANRDDARRDDRILPEVRATAALIILVLITAILALYLNPDKTDQFFAWTIKPTLTPMAMGAGYLMGTYFFARVLLKAPWHSVAIGFLPITLFTIAMLVATLLHLDKFSQGTPPFLAWLVIYILTPFLVPLLWWRNRVTEPASHAPGEIQVPRWARLGMGTVGALMLLLALVSFIFPDLLIAIFPWRLTPLTARVIAGWLSFPGLGGVLMARESRWSSWRVVVEAAYVGIIFFVLALPRAWGDLNQGNLLTWVLLAVMAASILLVPVFYLWMQRNPAGTVMTPPMRTGA